ncbi:MAG: NADH-quinone oxidoreductase subunit B family protein [Gaiellaceae bacterium]
MKPKLSVWKFSSCDGCQLSLLDCEDELLDVADAVDIAYFLEATSATAKGPYDLTLVEGSITTPHDAERIHEIRRASKVLVSIGACATTGGIQALRNFGSIGDFVSAVYATPAYISTLRTSTAIADHVPVDFELQGCPINKAQLLEVVGALLAGRRPNVQRHSVCVECKRAGIPCVMVARGVPCLGPVTQAGCGALCPLYARGCFACFGPKEQPNSAALAAHWAELGADERRLLRAFRGITANAPEFRKEATLHE